MESEHGTRDVRVSPGGAGNRQTVWESRPAVQVVLTDGAQGPARLSPMLPLAGLLSIQWVMDENPLTPLHPNYVKLLRLVAVLVALPAIVVALVLEVRGGLPRGVFLVPVALVGLWLIVRTPLRRYRARGYRMDADRLRVVRGMIFNSDTVVPFGRVQHIDVHQGPLERAYGLGTLVLHTAGNHNASVSLPGISHHDALAMREEIRAHLKRETM